MNSTGSTSIFDKGLNPVLQASITFGGVIVFILCAKLVKLTGLIYVPDRFPWMTAASFLLLFAMFNSVFSLSAENMLKYWGRSIYSYLGLAFASGLAAYFFSALSIDEAGSYRWIYVVLTIGYLVTEAETVWLTLTDGRAVPGHVLGYDQETGFGLIQALARLDPEHPQSLAPLVTLLQGWWLGRYSIRSVHTGIDRAVDIVFEGARTDPAAPSTA